MQVSIRYGHQSNNKYPAGWWLTPEGLFTNERSTKKTNTQSMQRGEVQGNIGSFDRRRVYWSTSGSAPAAYARGFRPSLIPHLSIPVKSILRRADGELRFRVEIDEHPSTVVKSM